MKKIFLLLLVTSKLNVTQIYGGNYFKKAWTIINSNKFSAIMQFKYGIESTISCSRCLKNDKLIYSFLDASLMLIKLRSAYYLWKEEDNETKLNLKLSLMENLIGFYYLFSIPATTKQEKILDGLNFIQLTLNSLLIFKKLRLNNLSNIHT